MNKKALMLALVSFLSLGLVVSISYAAGMTGKSGFMTYNSMDLAGATVKDSHGEFEGVIDEVMVDSGGHAFAIVNYYDLYYSGGVYAIVPLQQLRISQTKRGQDIASLRTTTNYGIPPYWTQSSAAEENRFKELNSLNLVGAAVENTRGKVVGIVNEVMVDSGGHAFAVINHGDYDLYGESGVNTLVPFEEIRISQRKREQDIVFLKTDTEHLDFAPYLNPIKKETRQDEANIYEYYGIQPYWTRSSESSR